MSPRRQRTAIACATLAICDDPPPGGLDHADHDADAVVLHALGQQFTPSWATGTGLRAMQAPPARGGAKGEAAKDQAE